MRNPEQNEILGAFLSMLEMATGEGAVKRSAGAKPRWTVDTGHPAAAGRHRAAYSSGERYDPDTGIHHLIKSAWRDLATAYQDMQDDGLIPEDPR